MRQAPASCVCGQGHSNLLLATPPSSRTAAGRLHITRCPHLQGERCTKATWPPGKSTTGRGWTLIWLSHSRMTRSSSGTACSSHSFPWEQRGRPSGRRLRPSRLTHPSARALALGASQEAGWPGQWPAIQSAAHSAGAHLLQQHVERQLVGHLVRHAIVRLRSAKPAATCTLSSGRRAAGSAEAGRPSEQAQNGFPVGIHHHATRPASTHTQLGQAHIKHSPAHRGGSRGVDQRVAPGGQQGMRRGAVAHHKHAGVVGPGDGRQWSARHKEG